MPPLCLALLIFLAPLSAHAQTEFANCGQVDEQLKKARSTLAEAQRQALFDALYPELSLLEAEARKTEISIPRGLLRRCLNTKREAFFTNLRNAVPGLRLSADTQWKLAQLQEVQGNHKRAMETYQKMVEQDANNSEARMSYFKLWVADERKRLQGPSNKTISLRDFKAYMDKVVELLNPIIDNPSTPTSRRIEALEIRSEFYVDFKQVLPALNDWKLLLELDPAHKKALESLSAFHLDRKMVKEAMGYLDRLIRIDPSNVRPQLALMRLQLEEEDKAGLLSTSLEAQRHHPQHIEVLAFRARALFEGGRPDDAKILAEEVLKKDPKNTLVLNLQARQTEAEGDSLQERKLYGNALQSYEQAARLLSGEPRTAARVNRKMALLIFDLRKADGFSPPQATAVDMDQVLHLLRPGLEQSDPDPTLLKVAVEAAAHSSQPLRGVGPCRLLGKIHFALLNADQVEACARIHLTGRQPSEARSLLDRALEAAKFESAKPQLKKLRQEALKLRN